MKIQKRPVTVEVRRAEPGEEIHTREGTLVAEDDDLIITGVEGEAYPIGPEILAKTYLPVDDEAVGLYRECLPPGVRVEFTRDRHGRTVPEGIYVYARDLSDAERNDAVAFVEEFIASSPYLDGDGEVPVL